MVLSALALVAMRGQLGTSSMLLTRRGARSVKVQYEVAFSIQLGRSTGWMSAKLEEAPIDAENARFTISDVKVRQGAGAWRSWQDGQDRTWEAPFLSARNMLGLQVDTAAPGTLLQSEGENLNGLFQSLPPESVSPLGGQITAVGYVAQRITLQGQMNFLLMNASRACSVEAQYDPYSGRPVRFSLKSIPTKEGAFEPTVELTIKAVGTGG